MFDDLDTAENKTEEAQKTSEGEQKSSWWIGRWAHVIALVPFCLIYFPFSERAWSWQVAVTISYIVFMLCCTCGLAFRDSDDFFGNLQVPRYVAGLLIRQIIVLALVSLGAYLWRHAIPALPKWATQEGRRISLWDTGGIVLVYVVAIREASWMANKIKSKFPELEDSF